MSNETAPIASPFESYMNEAKILLVDGSFTYRVALKQTLISFGALNENIVLSKNLKEARKHMESTVFKMIFSDFLLEDGIGTKLIKEKKECIFILVSSITTQAAVANAAEVEVDQFIFKPYSQEHLKTILQEVVHQKNEMTESNQYIEDGKELLSIGEFEKAAVLFEHAKNDPKSFARACSYLAEIKKFKNDLDGAFAAFREGLSSSEIHFRCLIGLFNMLLEGERNDDAYEVLKDILLHFPECPDRLSKALDLAVRTHNFVDIEELYEVFQLMYEKPENLLRHMTSALLVNGHYHLRNKNADAAAESFVRGISVGRGHDRFIHYVREKLSQFGMEEQVETILKRADTKKAA